MASVTIDDELMAHLHHLDLSDALNDVTESSDRYQDAPLFSRAVRQHLPDPSVFPQYGLIGVRQTAGADLSGEIKVSDADNNLIYSNMNVPSSVFICGSQGAGKSHTFSCLLENALLSNNPCAALPNPLTGIVFHYDQFTGPSSTQVCEAAYLCSSGIPVQVLVAPSNFRVMERLYTNLPGLPANSSLPKVRPLLLREKQLNAGNMKTLMSIQEDSGHPPLYLAVLDGILRDMARERDGRPGFDYQQFKTQLFSQGFTDMQLVPLKLRLQLLEEFLDSSEKNRAYRRHSENTWDLGPGSLTIVDLSCPFVKEGDACALFSICINLFLGNRNAGGRIIALDEAHKFLTKSGEAAEFTDQLISIIRQQRHLASRVIIATQEPTLSPALLDLCNVTFVHRFRSPQWLQAIQGHIAGASNLADREGTSLKRLFETIVGLRTGEALVFSPDALLDVTTAAPQRLLNNFARIRIRKRVTADGGKSIMAFDNVVVPNTQVASDSAQLTADRATPDDQSHGTGGVPLDVVDHADGSGTVQSQSMTRNQQDGFGASVWANSNAGPSSEAVVDNSDDTESSSDDEQLGAPTFTDRAPTIGFGFQDINDTEFALWRPELIPVAPTSVKHHIQNIWTAPAAAKQLVNTSRSKTTTAPPKLTNLNKAHRKCIRRVVGGMVTAGKPIDFGVVRRRVELDCGLEVGLLDGSPFKTISKGLIKNAVVSCSDMLFPCWATC